MSVRHRIRDQIASRPAGRRLIEARRNTWFIWKILTGHEHWPGMRAAFNSQRDRTRAVRAIIEQFEPDAFIETGTFIASTTRFFSGNNAPVYSAEVNRRFATIARLRLGWDSDVSLFIGDSREMLETLVDRHPFERPLAYLDAHWGPDLPLDEELALLCSAWSEAIIVVDDFRVDGDDGYGYDEYGGKSLSLADVAIPDGTLAAFPATPSASETGARRGTLFLAHGEGGRRVLAQLVDCGLLRPA